MITELTRDNIEKVVALHKRVLGHTLNARVGSWFLQNLYRITRDATGNGLAYVCTDGTEVLGFITACRDHASLEDAVMRGITFAQKVRVVATISLNPFLWSALTRQRVFSKYLRRAFEQPYATILTLGVSPNAQGRGIGRQLVDRVRDELRLSGHVGELYVDTEVSNASAARFYEKNGFRRVAIKSGNIVLVCAV